MMRILHILDHSIPLHSGYTFRTRAILEQQRALGWETCHLTSPKHQGAKGLVETVDGFTFHRTPPPTGWTARMPVLDQLAVVRALERRLEALIPELRPDILHAHSPALNGLAALRAARRHGLPLVYECRAFWEDAAVDHGTTTEGSLRYRLTRALETYVFRHADAVTTICEGLKSDIVARGIPEAKVTVIPNAVDPGRFTFGAEPDPELQRSLGLTGKCVLGFIGSFYAYEGLSLAIQALPDLLRYDERVRLLLVGGGPEEAALRAQVEQCGLNGKVVFTGRVPHDQVPRYYNLVDIFVYPRLPMRLTELVTPLKPLEAMARGRLVVASDVGGHRELIQDGKTGFLFRAGRAESLVETVVRVLVHQDRWPEVLAAARRFVTEQRTWESSVARYRPLYERLYDPAH
ncbi:glycogen synthase [Methylomarinovum tepidoasis]|uniref:Glycogen synthase n=1 Tax=Methylomarinovum tepidoasis TaxID=2840183 RepID=A0AAU9CB75_9GAMM|nr:TIGR04063 family PEP-CTERM/XrtA system glycosyltransferase [Methylomarinovum sp. IN45]BCX89805.1 glycogen synthase [Methylomarinovum sp. IN45]